MKNGMGLNQVQRVSVTDSATARLKPATLLGEFVAEMSLG